MPFDGACEDGSLDFSADTYEFLQSMTVGDACDVLLDDRTRVELFGHVMSGGPDDLHATIQGTTIWVGPDEGRQKRMVDVDDWRPDSVDEVAGQNLHVAG